MKKAIVKWFKFCCMGFIVSFLLSAFVLRFLLDKKVEVVKEHIPNEVYEIIESNRNK